MVITRAEKLIQSWKRSDDNSSVARWSYDLFIPLCVFIAAFALYITTMTPGLGGGIDSAELQYAAHDLSIVHPTGYPLYLLVAHGFITLVPFGDVAWRVTLLSALFCAIAVVLVYAIVVYLCNSRVAALVAVGMAATHPLIWQQAVIAEVNSLNLLLVAATSYALLRWSRASAEQPGVPLELAGFLFGLALANHRVSLLALPAIVMFVIWSAREGARFSLAILGRTFLCLMMPLLLYLYIPIRAETSSWYRNSWDNFWYEVGGESAWPVIQDTLQRPLLPRVRMIFNVVFGEPGWATVRQRELVGLLQLSGLGMLALTVRVWWRDCLVRRAVLGLLAPMALSVAAVMVIYDVDVIGDYLSMVVLLTSILAGLGAGMVLDRLPANVMDRADHLLVVRAARAGVWIVLLVALVWHGWSTRPEMDRSNDDAAQIFWEEVRGWDGTPAELDQHALLISPWHRYNEVLYLQAVDGWRPDLQPVVLDDIVAGNRLDLIDEWLAQRRPVYLLESTPSVLDHFLAEQQGRLWRITARGQPQDIAMQHPLGVRLGNDITLLGFTLQPEQIQPGGLLRVTLFWRADAAVGERYVMFAHLLDAAGNKIGQRDDEPGRGQRPTVDWTPGETITDSLLVPIDLAAEPGRYRLMVGMYSRVDEQRLPVTGPQGEEFGDYWQMVEVEVVP